MVRLFIENTEIELTNDVQFALNREFEELSNPTTIINEWSKTVSIPFSAKNNQTFGHIYNCDKMTFYGGGVGVSFNPLQKLDFRLEWNGSILMMGYAKMNEVKQKSGNGTYQVTLFGQLGKIFQEMQKITFDTTSPDADYIIDGSKYIEERITKELVNKSWTSTGQTTSTLYNKYIEMSGNTMPNPFYKVTDIIGFAPNNAYAEGFDYESFQDTSKSSKTFADELGSGFTQYTGVDPDTVIGDGLLPREIGEYRSYQQLPFVYWNKLFQMFQAKAESITGYQFDLDPDWFKTTNPYWHDLVYMLKPLSTGNVEEVSNTLNISDTSEVAWLYTENYTTPKNIYLNYNGSSVDFVDTISTPNNLILTNEYILATANPIKFRLSWYRDYEDGRLYKGNGVEISVLSRNVTANVVIDEYKAIICDEDYSGSTSSYDEVIRTKYSTAYSQGSTPMSKLEFDVNPDGIMLNNAVYSDVARIEVKVKFVNNNSSIADSTQASWMKPSAFHVDIISDTYNMNQIIGSNKRSYSYFTMNTLWNNDYSLFGEILKYCKMYRIGININDVEKKVVFKPFYKYFQYYTVTDWTNKVDRSKDFTITPVTFDTKYVLFNYEDSNTDLGSMYKEKYGVNYGDYRLVTEYEFNNETNELFEGVTPSIMNTDNVLSWTNLYDNHKVIYSFPNEIYVYNKDEDKKQVDIFGSYYFHNGLATFSTEEALNLRSVILTDDTVFQQGNSTYMYAQQQGTHISVLTYPKLDIVNGDNMCVFNVPKENYTYLNNYGIKYSIYYNFWYKYIQERYNVQNKLITCYINLKPIEYNNFSWEKFVKIGNQLCMVNKIYDYDVTSDQPTKVDLITIQSINCYITNNYTDNNI